MQHQKKSAKKAKANHIIAFTFAIVFHIGALYALTGNGSDVNLNNLVPDFAKEWLDIDKEADKKKSKTKKDKA